MNFVKYKEVKIDKNTFQDQPNELNTIYAIFCNIFFLL
jgi:hypothetical protein